MSKVSECFWPGGTLWKVELICDSVMSLPVSENLMCLLTAFLVHHCLRRFWTALVLKLSTLLNLGHRHTHHDITHTNSPASYHCGEMSAAGWMSPTHRGSGLCLSPSLDQASSGVSCGLSSKSSSWLHTKEWGLFSHPHEIRIWTVMNFHLGIIKVMFISILILILILMLTPCNSVIFLSTQSSHDFIFFPQGHDQYLTVADRGKRSANGKNAANTEMMQSKNTQTHKINAKKKKTPQEKNAAIT